MKWFRGVLTASALALLGAGGSGAVAAEGPRALQAFAPRLIVKFKADATARDLSAQQIQAQARRPLSPLRLEELSAAAGTELRYGRPLATGGHVLVLPAARSPQAVRAAMAALKARADVEYVEEDGRKFRQSLPNDPYLSMLWSFRAPELVSGGALGADFLGAWSRSTGAGVTVAVLDTGILPHPDLVGPGGTLSPATGNLVSPGYTFVSNCFLRGTCPADAPPEELMAELPPVPGALDLGDAWPAELADDFCPAQESSWHGTRVAGIVAALGNNSTGALGGAYGARILPVRVTGKCAALDSDIAEGILWAAGRHPDIPNPDPARVINLSLSSPDECGQTLQAAIDAAVGAGAVVVVAAGNENAPARLSSPGNCAHVITVAATGRYGEKARYSNHDDPSGPAVIALAAPGGSPSSPADNEQRIPAPSNHGLDAYEPDGWGYRYSSGTSAATPHVSAAVALMLSRNTALTPRQVRALLTAPSSVTPFPADLGGLEICTTASCGAGILNAERAVRNSLAVLAASPEVLDFGAGNVTKGATQTVSFTNANPVLPVSVGGVTIGGAGAAAYAKGADSCSGATVHPGQSCAVEVTMSRSSVGDFAASLELATLASQGGEAGAVVVALAGSSSAVVQAVDDALQVPQAMAGRSSVVEAKFRNVGVESALMGALALSSPDIMAVSSDGCSNVTLAPGASCTARITVTPKAAGSFGGTVSLKSAAAGDPGAQVSVSGVAAQAPVVTAAGGGGGCTALPVGQDGSDLSLLAYLGAALAFGWTRRRRPGRQ